MRYLYILAIGLLVMSCTQQNEERTIISALDDRTENDFIAKPTTNAIVSALQIDADIWAGYGFRYGQLTDMEHTRRYETFIEPKFSLFDNEFKRKKEVADFKKDIATALESDADSLGRSYSRIWEPILAELRVLGQDSLQDATLYVFSDLRENTPWFSTYRYRDSIQLLEHPNKVARLYVDKAEEFVGMDNVEMVIVFEPKTVLEDISFAQHKKLYQDVCDILGVSIRFTANLNQE